MRATWKVSAYDSNKQRIYRTNMDVEYTGQAVTIDALKTVTANQFNLIYDGNPDEQFHPIEAKSVLDKTAVFVTFGDVTITGIG